MAKNLPALRRYQSGQTVLIVLLAVAVIVTIGLSVVSRSVSDIKISQQSQESARAFWVAQAGLDKAIKSNVATSGELNSVSYNVTSTGLGGSQEYIFPGRVSANDTVPLWLVGHNPDGTLNTASAYGGNSLDVYWGDGSEATALEATLIYESAGSKLFKRFAFDGTTRTPETSFTLVTGGGILPASNKSFAYKSTITFPSGVTKYLLKLRLIYNTTSQPIGILATANLPDQGKCFVSSASITESNVTRKLKECLIWPTTAGVFDYLLFSGGSI